MSSHSFFPFIFAGSVLVRCLVLADYSCVLYRPTYPRQAGSGPKLWQSPHRKCHHLEALRLLLSALLKVKSNHRCQNHQGSFSELKKLPRIDFAPLFFKSGKFLQTNLYIIFFYYYDLSNICIVYRLKKNFFYTVTSRGKQLGKVEPQASKTSRKLFWIERTPTDRFGTFFLKREVPA